MDSVLADLRHSLRLFLRAPGFSLAAIAALALGIAANTAIFSVVDAVLINPYAYPEPGRVVMFQNAYRQGLRSGSASPVEFNWWRRQTGAFQDISAYSFNVVNLTGDAVAEQIPANRVSAGFFQVCGANPIRGRTFTQEDDAPNAAKTVVLAYGFWQRHFAGDARAVGANLILNGEPYRVIGVVGAELQRGQITEQALGSGELELDLPPDVYLPYQLDPNSRDRGHYFNVIGRLKPGVTLAEANLRLQAGFGDYARQWRVDTSQQTGFNAEPLQAAVVSNVRRPLRILLGAVGFVMLIACANVASLMLARATGRRREMAIRAAVGASRARIVRQLLTESALLAMAGGAVGLAAGYAGIRAILSLSPAIPRIGLGGSNVALDWRVLGFTMGVAILSAVLCGLAPALQASRTDLTAALKERVGTGLRHNRTRALLVTTEIALALVLLTGASLLIRTFAAIRHVETGFETRNMLTMRMSMTGPQFAKVADVTRVIHESVRRLRALPGVEDAAVICCVPLEDRLGLRVRIAGRAEGTPGSEGNAGWTLVSAGFFETFRIPVLRGRLFTEHDDGGPRVAIINQTLAQQFFAGSDPLDGRIAMGRGPDSLEMRIVGVVGDIRDDALTRTARPVLYVPLAQMTDAENAMVSASVPLAWVVRTRESPLGLRASIQNELREASGGLPVASVRTMDESIARSMAVENFNTVMLTIFGAAALLLAAIGIYGLMAYSVAQRAAEMGIRVALGARSGQIRRMVVWQGLRIAVAGVAIGLAASMGLTRVLSSFLFGVKEWDPVTFIVVPSTLIGVALVAAWLPAVRASRANPITALRSE